MLKKCMCLILSAVLTMTLVVQVWAGEEVQVTSGEHENHESISTDKDKGADVDADGANGGDSSLDVKGDVEVNSSGDYSTPVTGIEVSAENSGSAVVTVGGDVDVVSDKSDKVTGVDVNIDSAGSAVRVDVKGGISAAGTNGLSEVTGIKAVVDGRSLNAAIGGDISSTGADATGIDVKASGQSSVNVNVGGGINTEKKASTDSTKDSNGIELDASGSGTEISARVAGDVKGSGMDSSVEIKTENGAKVDVVAEGTLSAGKEAAVAFAGSPDNVSLIIWKAEAGTDGSIVKEVIDNNGNKTLEKTVAAETLENSIHYIIRVEPSQSIDLGNTQKMSYTTPDSSVINYNTAKKGEKVAVKLNVPSGYVLKGVFSDEAKQCSLQKEGGEYYLIVPKGGGVFVNMWLEAKSDSSKNDGSTKEPAGKKSGGENKDKDHETTYEGSEGNPVTAPNEAGAYTMRITEEKPEMSMTGRNLLNISFPAGTDRFTLNLADIQQYIEAGMSQFVINTPYRSVMIPVDNLLPYLQAGIPVTFILNNGLIEALVNGSEKIMSLVIRDNFQQQYQLAGSSGRAEKYGGIKAKALQAEAEALRQAEAGALQLAAELQRTRQGVAGALQQAAEQQQTPQAVAEQPQTQQGEAEALQQVAVQQQALAKLQQTQQGVAEQPQALQGEAEAYRKSVTVSKGIEARKIVQEPALGQQQTLAKPQQTQQAEAEDIKLTVSKGIETKKIVITAQEAQQAVAELQVSAGKPAKLKLPQAQQAVAEGLHVQLAAEQPQALAKLQQAQQAAEQRKQQFVAEGLHVQLAAEQPQVAEQEQIRQGEAEAGALQQVAEQEQIRQGEAEQQQTQQAEAEAPQQVGVQVQLTAEQQWTPQAVAEVLQQAAGQDVPQQGEAETLQQAAELQRTPQAVAETLQQKAKQPQAQQAASDGIALTVSKGIEARKIDNPAQELAAVQQRAAELQVSAKKPADLHLQVPHQQAAELHLQVPHQQAAELQQPQQGVAEQQQGQQAEAESLQDYLLQVDKPVDPDYPQLAEEQQAEVEDLEADPLQQAAEALLQQAAEQPQAQQGVAEQPQTQQTETEAEAHQLTAEQLMSILAKVKTSSSVIEGEYHFMQKPEQQAVAEFRRQAEAGGPLQQVSAARRPADRNL